MIYWEDLVVGSVRQLGTVTPTREEIVDFAGKFDPQPFHLTDEGGKASLFGGLCASGWHTCSMAMGLMVRNFLSNSSSLGSPGLDNIRWFKPVHPGDTLRLEHEIMERRASQSKPDVGLVYTVWRMYNQHEVLVMRMEGTSMFRRRHPGTSTADAAHNASSPA